jgi:hypothetical protein
MIKKIKAKDLSFTNPRLLMQGLELSLFMDNELSVLSATNSQVFVWGANRYFNLHSNKTITWPQGIFTGDTLEKNELIIVVSTGYNHVGYLTNFGNLVMQGNNTEGQLGKKGFFVRRPEFDLKNQERITQIHCIRNVSSAKTNFSRMFIWGDNEQGYSDHQLLKIVKPFEVTNAFQLTKDETITSYQLIDGTNSSIYQWLFIINQNIYML